MSLIAGKDEAGFREVPKHHPGVRLRHASTFVEHNHGWEEVHLERERGGQLQGGKDDVGRLYDGRAKLLEFRLVRELGAPIMILQDSGLRFKAARADSQVIVGN